MTRTELPTQQSIGHPHNLLVVCGHDERPRPHLRRLGPHRAPRGPLIRQLLQCSFVIELGGEGIGVGHDGGHFPVLLEFFEHDHARL